MTPEVVGKLEGVNRQARATRRGRLGIGGQPAGQQKRLDGGRRDCGGQIRRECVVTCGCRVRNGDESANNES